ncbi:MAG: hypothetical protein ACRBEQ_14470 [Hyphomonas sp.]
MTSDTDAGAAFLGPLEVQEQYLYADEISERGGLGGAQYLAIGTPDAKRVGTKGRG